MYLHQKSQTKSRNVNVLFAPGMPGLMKSRPIFDDLASLGCDIYSFYYSGTYGEDGTFDIAQSLEDFTNNLKLMEKMEEPFILISYSYSTLLAMKIDLSQYKNLINLSLFSPILGLDKKSIEADFHSEMIDLANQNQTDFKINKATLGNQIATSSINFEEVLAKLDNYEFPVVFGYSLLDKLINVKRLHNIIEEYKDKYSRNSFLVWALNEGYHGLDSYYCDSIHAFYEGLLISNDLKKIINDKLYIYFWGSQITMKSNEASDIDLLVFTKSDHLKYAQVFRDYLVENKKVAHHHFDLSINDLADIFTLKSYRFNRGVAITKELQYHHFPIYKIPYIPEIQTHSLLEDVYNATRTNLNEAKKIMLKTDLSSERIKKIPKFALFSYIYNLYFLGFDQPNWSKVKSYYISNKQEYQLLDDIEELQKNNYKNVTIELLTRCINGIALLLEQQESKLKNLDLPDPMINKRMKSFYIMRHAQKDKQNSYNSIVNSELSITQDGEEKTKVIAQYLLKRGINHVFSSKYLRSQQTAEIIASSLDIKVKTRDNLHEKVFATQDINAEESLITYNMTYTDWDYSNYGGESINESISRYKKALSIALAEVNNEKSLFVSHGRVMQSMFSQITNYTKIDFSLQELQIDFCQVYEVYYDDEADDLRFVAVVKII